MTQGEFLDKPELHQLTGCAYAKPQAAWLRAEGIPFKENARGLLVCRVHVRAWMEGKPIAVSSQWKPIRQPF